MRLESISNFLSGLKASVDGLRVRTTGLTAVINASSSPRKSQRGRMEQTLPFGASTKGTHGREGAGEEREISQLYDSPCLPFNPSFPWNE